MPKKQERASSMLGYLMLFGSLFLFIHSAMGVSQYKHWLSLHDDTHKALPMDIILECFAGLATAIFSVTFLIANPFREIVNTSETQLRSIDGLFYSEDFASFRIRRHPINKLAEN
mmetsp:Transcript_57372/g.91302  ORF Transcript_57372/g.91302 Transcript_57372/m.91302 type:complete len:115 (+) Transcript_57372:80-424(+)